MPSRLLHSAPNTPSRGKVVLSKKERKELSKQLGIDESSILSSSAQSSPYKGRVSELKNCIARGLFATLHRGSQKSLHQQDERPVSQEISPPPPAPESANNNEDVADYSEKLKNLPVRQRKAATSHMENYCLFDPVDFINEKAMRYPSSHAHGLRDPLFSSRQHLVCEDEDEMVPEVIYDNEELELEETIIIETSAMPEAESEAEPTPKNTEILASFDHHNYFIIEPGDFAIDIGIPNPYTNEQVVNAKLEQQNLEKLFSELENTASMSNSQESKDTETTSTALVESSTSTNSASSAGSCSLANPVQQSMKKKLTFLNPRSPQHRDKVPPIRICQLAMPPVWWVHRHIGIHRLQHHRPFHKCPRGCSIPPPIPQVVARSS